LLRGYLRTMDTEYRPYIHPWYRQQDCKMATAMDVDEEAAVAGPDISGSKKFEVTKV